MLWRLPQHLRLHRARMAMSTIVAMPPEILRLRAG
jgi:hypothetical protein